LQESFSDILDYNDDDDDDESHTNNPPHNTSRSAGNNGANDNDSCHGGMSRPTATHFCFLVHGHRGVARDLWYMQMSMQRFAALQKRKQKQKRKEWLESKLNTANGDGDDRKNDGGDDIAVANDDDRGSIKKDVGIASSMSEQGDLRVSSDASSAVIDTNDRTGNPTEERPQNSNQRNNDGRPNKDLAATVMTHKESMQYPLHDMIVHSTVCNEGKTTDGIEHGGDRLVDEMMEVIQSEMDKRMSNPKNQPIADHDITLSIVGNSLGGLYGRYAIAKFIERFCESGKGDPNRLRLKHANYNIHLNIFCTTATPHLGVSRHTFLPIPRPAEIGVAHAMGETGRDLFRLNDLLRTMSTDPSYLRPLGNFRKRVAYANAYGTDFPVPTATAAFLSQKSSYPHHFFEPSATTASEGRSDSKAGEGTSDDEEDPAEKFIIARLETPRQEQQQHPEELEHKHNESPAATTPTDQSSNETEQSNSRGSLLYASSLFGNSNSKRQLRSESNTPKSSPSEIDELHEMSVSLDRLGWKKVFLDMRKELPSMEIPESAARVIRKRQKQLQQMRQKQGVQSSDDDDNDVVVAVADADADDANCNGGGKDFDDSVHNNISNDGGSGDNDGIIDDVATTTHKEDNKKFTNDDELDALRERGMARSKDLATVISLHNDNRLYFPAGHNMMVAFSRSKLSSFLHKGGRPVVDALARELVRDIFEGGIATSTAMNTTTTASSN